MSKFSENLASFCFKRPWLVRLLAIGEDVFKKPMFGCQSCGQCALSSTALICPMRCPKQIRNGPCGGTRANGHCEVYEERPCIWWLIYNRSKRWRWVPKLKKFNTPVDRRLQSSSAWLNMFAGQIEKLRLDRGLEFEEKVRREDAQLRERKKRIVAKAPSGIAEGIAEGNRDRENR